MREMYGNEGRPKQRRVSQPLPSTSYQRPRQNHSQSNIAQHLQTNSDFPSVPRKRKRNRNSVGNGVNNGANQSQWSDVSGTLTTSHHTFGGDSGRHSLMRDPFGNGKRKRSRTDNVFTGNNMNSFY